MPRKSKFEPPVFEHQRSRSEASRRAWQERWERGEAIGKKGEKFLKDKYDIPEDWIEAPIYDEYWEWDY